MHDVARLGLGEKDCGGSRAQPSRTGLVAAARLATFLGRRIDTRSGSKGCVFFMNNIEKDKAYRRWPKQIAQLMQPAWQLIPVRKNLYTGIFVVDPTTETGLKTIGTLRNLLQMKMPIRAGLALVPSDVHHRSGGGAVDGDDSEASVDGIVRLLAAAKKAPAAVPLPSLGLLAAGTTGRRGYQGRFRARAQDRLGQLDRVQVPRSCQEDLRIWKVRFLPRRVRRYVAAKGLPSIHNH